MARVVVMSIMSLRAGSSSIAAGGGAPSSRLAATAWVQISPCNAVDRASSALTAPTLGILRYVSNREST